MTSLPEVRPLQGAPELLQLETSINHLVQRASEMGLPVDMPVPSLDKALSQNTVALLLPLQKLLAAASTAIAASKITDLAKACEIATKDSAFRIIEAYINHVGDALASIASGVGGTERMPSGFMGVENDSQALMRQRNALQRVEAQMKTFWEFYRRVKNTQSLAISMITVARKIQDGDQLFRLTIDSTTDFEQQ